MRTKNIFQIAGLLSALFFSNFAMAYEDERPKEDCRDPKFKGFNLPAYNAADKIEVAPESDITFTVSGWTNPETIVVTAKNEPLDISIEDKMIFYRIRAKLPAKLNGKFVRINAKAFAVLGCKGEAGWLVKVAENKVQEATVEEKVEPAEEKNETQPKTAE